MSIKKYLWECVLAVLVLALVLVDWVEVRVWLFG